MDKADTYVASLRNAAKRSYAQRYLNWMRACGPAADEPERGSNLSAMAAQAVRMTLRQLYREDYA